MNSLAIRKIRLLVLASLTVVVGCTQVGQTESVIQYFDRSSGATITTLTTPFSFFKAELLLAANSRDYIYMGPIEINQAGRREYFLWFDFCSTIDRYGYAQTAVPDKIFLLVDGTPMELATAGNDRLYRASGAGLYSAPVAGGQAVLYSITRDQLRKLAQAGQIRVIAESENRYTDEFLEWNGAKKGFLLFADYLFDNTDIVFAAVQ